MSIFTRKRRNPRDRGMSRFTAGLLAILLVAVGTYFGFTKANPFANPFELEAVFDTANNLKPGSPVRIAGVDVGEVKSIEPIVPDDRDQGSGAARVTMEIDDKGLPLHTDAELKVRPRIFLEGNFFVDVQPGSPSAPIQEKDGGPIPTTQTAAPVQFGDVLAALESDTRTDLQVFLKEYSAGLAGKGARGFNQSLRNGEEAFKNASIANDATLGLDPTKDLQRVLRGQAETFAALVEDEAALKGLVTNFNTFAGSLASEDAALRASIPALRDTLRVGSPALASLNSALPSLRAFAVDALPGVRSSTPTLRASLPFIRQARALVRPAELRSAARELRRQIPALVAFNRTSIPLFEQGRALSACTNNVLVPFANTNFDDPDFPENTGTVNQKIQRSFVGLAGESRIADANQSLFHTSAVPLPDKVRPAPPTTFGSEVPPRKPGTPCETQDPPNLEAPVARVTPGSGALAPTTAGNPAPADTLGTGLSLPALRSIEKTFRKYEEGRERRREALRRESKSGEAKP